MAVRLDLNNPVFQRQWFALAKEDQLAVFASLFKLSRMSWDQVYRDKGLRWELVHSRQSPDGSRLYSIRITRKVRAVARRSGDFIELFTLHADHDSAYE